jgi:hypothetical protein
MEALTFNELILALIIMNTVGHPSRFPLPASRGEGVRRTGEGDGSYVGIQISDLRSQISDFKFEIHGERLPQPVFAQALPPLRGLGGTSRRGRRG